jgi:hypothetical protein
MVVGFKGGTWNPTSGNLTVRNSDAHAWCELLDRAKQQWVRVDPTPGADVLGDRTAGLAGAMVLATMSDHTFSALFDSLRMFWYRRIVDFSRGSQVELAQRARQAVEGFGRGLKDWLGKKLDTLHAWALRPWDWHHLVVVAEGVGLLVAIGLGRRALSHAWLRKRGANPVRREAGRWLVRLGTRADSPEGAELGGQLRRLRFGAPETWPEPAKIFRATRRFWRGRSA